MRDEEQLRERILTGAREQFERFGLRKTTMDDIAKSIGMGKSSIYYYYKSKDDIFDSVLDDEMLKLRYAVDKEVQQKKDLAEKLIAYSTTYFAEVVPRQTLYRIVNQEDQEAGSKTRLKKIIGVEVEYMKTILAGDIPQNTADADLQTFAEAIISAMYGVMHYSFMINDNMNEKRFEQMMRSLMPMLV